MKLCVPVSLLSERCQICPSSEVVKWSLDHIMLKLSSKNALDMLAATDEKEAAMKARVRKTMEDEELSIVCERERKRGKGSWGCSLNDMTF